MKELTPGMLYKVRDWDDMKREFGINSSGHIPCWLSFVPEMRRYCGKTYKARDDFKLIGIDLYSFSTDMVIPIDDRVIAKYLKGGKLDV